MWGLRARWAHPQKGSYEVSEDSGEGDDEKKVKLAI